jgi:hypothetical protein
MIHSRKCLVLNCKRVAETTWEPDMRSGILIPVCLFHYSRKLWWYKGTIFCRDEEEG